MDTGGQRCDTPNRFTIRMAAVQRATQMGVPHPKGERFMDGQTRTPWSRPELIVFARSKPEEAVLANCKTGSGGTPISATGTCSQNLCNTTASS